MYKKNKIEPDKGKEPQLNDRILQLQNEAAAVNCTYSLSEYDVQELVHEKYIAKFPDTFYMDIQKMVRVQKDKKEFLIYYTGEEVTDTVQFKKRKFNRKRIGFHPVVTGEAVYDNYGTLTDYEIGTPRTSFDIPFTADKVKEIISKARSGPKELLIAHAASIGEQPLLDPIYSVFNLDDFLYGEFDLLFGAGRLGYLNSGTGYQEFLRVRSANLEHATPTISKKEHGSQERER